VAPCCRSGGNSGFDHYAEVLEQDPFMGKAGGGACRCAFAVSMLVAGYDNGLAIIVQPGCAPLSI
jgi:hypothetical protein